MKKKLVAGLAIGLLISCIFGISNALAMSLNWDYPSGSRNLDYFGPMGQTFLATDSDIDSIGFYLDVWNPESNVLTFEVYSGVGLSGDLLYSQTVTDLYSSGWEDFIVSNVFFEGGQTYTAVVSGSGGLGFQSHQHTTLMGTPMGPNYLGGDMIINASIDSFSDARFRIMGGEEAPVPEPSTILLLGAGLFGLCVYRRRAKK